MNTETAEAKPTPHQLSTRPSSELCPVLDACGGCPWMRQSDESQKRAHGERVRHALAQAGIDLEEEPGFVRGPSTWNYRNRLRLKVHANGHVGFFNPDKNTDCMVLSPSVRRIAQRVRDWAQSDAQNASRLSHLEVRGEDLDGKAGLYMVLNEPTQRLEMEPLKRALADDVLMVVAGEGDVPYQRFGLDDDLYAYVPLDGFMQVNHAINDQLRKLLVQGAAQRGTKRFVDLYCGAGNLSLPLMRSGQVGLAVEMSSSSIRGARRAAEEQGLDPSVFHACNAAQAFELESCQTRVIDLVVSNPPRAGMRDACDAVLQASPRHIALCYCNPESLAQDLKRLTASGYGIQELSLLNMFPHTRHVETLVWLERRQDPAGPSR